MGLLKYASSMENFQKYVDTHEEVLSNMSVKAAAVLNEFCTADCGRTRYRGRRSRESHSVTRGIIPKRDMQGL